MKTSISKSALGIVFAGLVLIIAAIWFGMASHKKAAPVEAPPAIETPAAVPAAKPAPKPAPAPARPAIVRTTDTSLAVIPISLTNVIIGTENNVDAAMKSLPSGTQVYGGIEFWLQGMVQLQSLATRDEQRKNFRTSIIVPLAETNFPDGKPVVTQRGQNIASLYFLGGVRFAASHDGEKFADVVWHYTDGTAQRSGLAYNVHLRDWARKPYESPAQLPNTLTRVAWHGDHPSRKDRTVRLYRVAVVNPHPEKVISAVEFASTLTRPSLFVCALTLDPLMPGARPDNLTSDEVADPELNGQLQIYVQDTGGHALPGAQVNAVSVSKPAGSITQKFTTDNNGVALVRFPDTGLERLEVTASHDDYSGRRMIWDLKSGDTLPATYTLKLDTEVKIGGIVVDAENNPIPDAKISLYRYWSGSDGDPNRKGEQPSFSNQQQTTDSDGRWQAKGLPPTLLDHIGFEITHPDYVRASANVRDNPTTEKQLRDGTYKSILQHGADVRGRVVDTSDQPIAGATVWAGRKYSGDRKQTTTDGDGRFFFHSVDNANDLLFAVMATGHSPDYKTVKIEPGMPEILFRLKAGSTIHAHVQDESAQPVANARVGLEGSYGEPSYDAYEFTANTDSNGDFSWTSAPDEPMTFYIFHDGFEAKRNAKLAPNQDNTVTLRRSRTLQGVVLDDSNDQPVTKFTARTGTANGDDSTVYGVIRNREFSAADGKFSLTIDEEGDNAVLIYAEGYADKVEKFPDAQDGTVSVVVRLKPSGSLSGTVIAPDGTPAPGVSVAVASEKPRTSIQLSGGHLRSYDSRSKMAVTDAQGHFKIDVPAEDGSVLAVGDQGFASAPLDAVRSSGTLTLQAWGRIEGTLKIGGQPGVGKDLLFNLSIPGIWTDFNGYKATTDDQGKFTMEKIPPGDGAIVRLISTSPNSWTHSDSTSVNVKSGETTQVSLGDNGAVIVGSIRYDNPPTNAAALDFEGGLSMPMPERPAFNSPDDAKAYYQSPVWKALMKLRKNYTIEIKPDGTFTADDIAPGNYTLNIGVRMGGERQWEHPPLAQGSTQVTVPDSFNPTTPIDVGQITLTPSPQQPPQ